MQEIITLYLSNLRQISILSDSAFWADLFQLIAAAEMIAMELLEADNWNFGIILPNQTFFSWSNEKI